VVVADGADRRERQGDIRGVRGDDLEVRFADLDGDGRTDVVVRAKSAYARKGLPSWGAQVFMAPRSVDVEGEDYAREIAAAAAPTVDRAVQDAMAITNRGVSRDEACGLLAKLTDGASLAGALAPGALFVDGYTSPGTPTTSEDAVFAPPADAAAHVGAVALAHDHCEQMACNPGRPYCNIAFWNTQHFVFTWVSGAPKLLFLASNQRGY
jgi:hypothetical protein